MQSEVTMDMQEFSEIVPFDNDGVMKIHHHPGVYVIYRPIDRLQTDVELYIGRSEVDIHRRLMCHLHGRGNRVVGEMARLHPGKLSFNYMYLPKYDPENPGFNAREAEAILIAEIGLDALANRKHEGLYEVEVQQDKDFKTPGEAQQNQV